MHPDKLGALRTVRKRLENAGIRWALAGSTNMLVQGIPSDPRDMDIAVRREDLGRISGLFSDFSSTPVREFRSLAGGTAWEVRTNISGIKVQFFGGDEDDVYVSKLLAGRTVNVRFGGIEIPCFALEAESRAYREMGRPEKAETIDRFLSGKGGGSPANRG